MPSAEQPFVHRALDAAHARALGDGFTLNGTGPAMAVAHDTPP